MKHVDLKESEQVVLSYILSHPEQVFELSELSSENFEAPENKQIFEILSEIHNSGKDIIVPAIVERVEVDEVLKRYIVALYAENVMKTTFLMHKRYLIEKSNRRNVVNALSRIVKESEDPQFDVYRELSAIEISKSVEEKRDFKVECLKRLETKMRNGGVTENILTGIASFDECVGGFAKGGFYIIAGRSSMGKSAFMTSICEHIEQTHKVGIISLEMTGEELYNRMACVRSKIPYWVIDKGKATDAQFDAFAGTINSLNNTFLSDRGGLGANQVIGQIKRFVAMNKIDIAFIDHLGIVNLDDRLNRAHAIGKLTSALKSLAKELDIPIVSLCQVNRGVEGKESKRPRLSDLRDSGRIEEDADCVTLLYRPNYYLDLPVKQKIEPVELIVAKNRNGECKTVHCSFHGALMRMFDEAPKVAGGINYVD